MTIMKPDVVERSRRLHLSGNAKWLAEGTIGRRLVSNQRFLAPVAQPEHVGILLGSVDHWMRFPISSAFNAVENRQTGLCRGQEADIHVVVVLTHLDGLEGAVALRYCISEIDLEIMPVTDDGRTYWDFTVTVRGTNRDVNYRKFFNTRKQVLDNCLRGLYDMFVPTLLIEWIFEWLCRYNSICRSAQHTVLLGPLQRLLIPCQRRAQ